MFEKHKMCFAASSFLQKWKHKTAKINNWIPFNRNRHNEKFAAVIILAEDDDIWPFQV